MMANQKTYEWIASAVACHCCGANTLVEIPAFERLMRVTSDCRPWRAGGKLGFCQTCGTVQKPIDDAWCAEVEDIYNGYAIYQQGEGQEQAVFESTTGLSSSRSQRLFACLQQALELPASGSLLDVGCGNGALLRVVSQALPDWRLWGTELNDRHKREVESIPRVQAMHAGFPWEAPGPFDAVTVIHVLEHIVNPVEFLQNIARQVNESGLLIVESPNAPANPFDILIADHCTHFTVQSMHSILTRGGFAPRTIRDDWIPKELSVAAVRYRESAGSETPPESRHKVQSSQAIENHIHWLESLVLRARRLANERDLGLFGTSIAGSWLKTTLGDGVTYFVDEDTNRIGRNYLGIPIVAPGDVRPGGNVLIGLAPAVASPLTERLRTAYPQVHWHGPA